MTRFVSGFLVCAGLFGLNAYANGSKADDQANAVENVQGEIVYANRVPHSKDKGLFWVKDTGTDAVLYVRSKQSGTWVAQK